MSEKDELEQLVEFSGLFLLSLFVVAVFVDQQQYPEFYSLLSTAAQFILIFFLTAIVFRLISKVG